MSIVDRGVGWLADRWNYANYAFKYRVARKAPSFLAAELERSYGLEDLIDNYEYKELQRLSLHIPWVFSNIDKIAREVSSSPFHVYEKESQMRDFMHDFEEVIAYPNDFFSGVALLQYTIWALYLDRQGAYWFLAPDTGNGTLREIWPMPINRVTPIKHRDKFISAYRYQYGPLPEDHLRIDPRYICRFFLPDPRDLYRSLTPLFALESGINLYDGITRSQNVIYNQSRGIPLSIVSVDEAISQTDFDIVRQQIKEDWSGGSPIAIARAGTIDVKSVGISSRNLETLASREYNRDEIDSVFMGFPWRNSDETDLKTVEQQIKDQVIFPLHMLLAGQIQIQIIKKFYNSGGDYVGRFDDVRRQDRALLVQERNTYWRGYTFEDVQRDLGKKPFENESLPGFAKLPFVLATDPSFVATYYGLNQQQGGLKDDSQELGNIVEGEDPEKLTNRLARGGTREEQFKKGIDVDKAISEAQKLELKRWRTVAVRALEREKVSPASIEFETDLIDISTKETIIANLGKATTVEEVKAVFEECLMQIGAV